ncbi:MAG TPA: amidohydrolase family protein [Candidatus Limnocylindria bacterium]|jgi:L-fuconolactonase|nr:amidohydrolase family protein [Candidatus Limnocylindria bacterium]
MRLDSHQHFWSYSAAEYPWIPAGSALQRDWLPADLAQLQTELGFDGSIAVQARQSLAESRWLLTLADANPRIQGVVGWVDLQNDRVEEPLAELAANPKFVGVRHVVQDEPDDHFMLRPEFLRGIGKLRQFGLTYDLLIYPKQLPAAIELVRQFPDQPFVLDHIAKPFIRTGELSPWSEQIGELAKFPNVLCKVSGMVTEADHQAWKPDDFRPFLDVIFAAFGERRLMFGSDWPVCLLAASYAQTFGLVRDYAARLPAASQARLFGETAAQFYLRRQRP